MKLQEKIKKVAKSLFSRKVFFSVSAVILAVFSADKVMQHSDGYSEDLSKASADNLGHIVPKAYADHPSNSSGPDGSPGPGEGCPDSGPGDCPSGCFVAGTPIVMVDGTTKPIEKIKLGDNTFGGIVTATMKFIAGKNTTYSYKGISVSGEHIVYDEDTWRYVAESPQARLTEDPPNGMVYLFNCTNHLIQVNGVLFTDFAELDHEHPLYKKWHQDVIENLQMSSDQNELNGSALQGKARGTLAH